MEKQLDTTPFLAQAIAGNPAAREELERLVYKKTGSAKTARAKPKYGNFYQEHGVLAQWHCQKAEALIARYDAGDAEAAAALAGILQKGWGKLWRYVEDAPEPLSFDSWQIGKTQKGQGKKPLKISSLSGRRGRRDTMPPILSLAPAGRLPVQAAVSDSAAEDFVVFGQAALLLKKTIDWQEPFLASVFAAHGRAYREHKQGDDYAIALSGAQKNIAKALWRSIEEALGGIPSTLEEYFLTEEYRRNREKRYFFFKELLPDLPAEAIRTAAVGKKRLRRAMDAFAARLPEDAEITDGLKQTSLEAFLYALVTHAIARQYTAAARYALRGLEREDLRRQGDD
jgi:hypothetical protein